MKEERTDSIDQRLIRAFAHPLPSESWEEVPPTTRAELAASWLQVLVTTARVSFEDSPASVRSLR